ncbi:protein phosphatase 1 regulatory subunit 21-like isoform X2 [Artemia franciscana]
MHLRQALQEEQDLSKSLKENVEEKNQMIRRIQQEMDSLQFRNQQLMKRVEFLQAELFKDTNSGGSTKKTQTLEFPDVIEDELRSKIEENARLASQVADLHRSHGEEANRLRQRIIQLEHQVKEAHLRSKSIESISSKKESDTESAIVRPESLSVPNDYTHFNSQFDIFQNQIVQLEKEKEMWKLNYQLQSAKQQRSQEAEGFPSTPSSVVKTLSPETPGTSDADDVRKFFLDRLGQLVKSAQIADSKAFFFHSECTALQERLELLIQQQEMTETNLSKSHNEVQNLRSELQTTLLNYETQINTMSEHLASIIDQLAAKQEENDALKSQLNSKRRIS